MQNRLIDHFRRTVPLVLLSVVWFILNEAHAEPRQGDTIATFSIVARDSAAGELGVAVASRFFAVGAVVPWARADVGAVATQSFANTSFGRRGLELLEIGLTPEEALTVLLREDDEAEKRHRTRSEVRISY